MASISHTGPDTMVTVKVTFRNITRRVKMPLLDMIPHVLEEKVRTFLDIPAESTAVIERYSDSAGSFVVLDSDNVPVYKQLLRAAKAKSKLKLRVTIPEAIEKTVPKPVTVEDEPESSQVALCEQPAEDTPAAEEKELQQLSESATEAHVPSTESALETLASEFQLPVRSSPFAASTYSLPPRAMEHEAMLRAVQNMVNTSQTSTEPQPVPTPFAGSCPFTSQSLPAPFAVCCNNCERTVSDVHYHCQTCDDGDFDLCQTCVDQAVTCNDDNHWLIKRTMVDGLLVTSSTERIPPKTQAKKQEESADEEPVEKLVKEEISLPEYPTFSKIELPILSKLPFEVATPKWTGLGNMRTCNSCVQELPESEFLHCASCEDFDLCQPCFAKDGHGHHPKHAFVPAVAGTQMPPHVNIKMAPGRNQAHHAICDGCDKYITGVRHKCLDCPDWDYCSDCVSTAAFVHAKHRFAPIYEPLADVYSCSAAQPVHMGICCDGPLCANAQGYPTYIRGVRYKCAVCHDLDFCANCEANPSNDHNKTHPLIKFKTPVRHVSVTTTGEHQDGKRMPQMGDRVRSTSKATETSNPADGNSINAVQTVVDVKPESEVEPEIKREQTDVEVEDKEPFEKPTPVKEQDLRAVFLRDSVSDGTILPPNHVFEQTWVLRNEGDVAWPAGCSVKFVGGDYMGHVDSAHPAGISELVSASESTVCYAPLAPGSDFPFTVLLRTPARAGKIISYWRLTSPDGYKFGHRLWCDVSVRIPPAEIESNSVTLVDEPKKEESNSSDSVMIFPKLDKESPQSSIHEESQAESLVDEDKTAEIESLGEGAEDDEWDGSDGGFMTDEEYDILDASDEEYLEEQHKRPTRK